MTSVSTAWGRELETLRRGNRVISQMTRAWPKQPPVSRRRPVLSSSSSSFLFSAHVARNCETVWAGWIKRSQRWWSENKTETQDLCPGYQWVSLSLAPICHSQAHAHMCTHTHTYTQSERFHDWMHLHLAPTPRKSDSSRSPFWLSDLSFGSMGLKCTKWLCFLCHSRWRQNAFVTKKLQKHLKWNQLQSPLSISHRAASYRLCGDKVPAEGHTSPCLKMTAPCREAAGPSPVIKCSSTAPEFV